MKKVMLTVWLFLVSLVYACDLDYTGQTDSTICLQEIINNTNNVQLESGILLINNNLNLHNQFEISGNNTQIIGKFSKPETAFFKGIDVINVKINNLQLTSSGKFESSLFVNPYSQLRGDAIGFTNLDRGISIVGKSSLINISGVIIEGVEIGIEIDTKQHEGTQLIKYVDINNNVIKNVGKAGIRLINVNAVNIKYNLIENVQGNMAYGKNPVLSDTKFGDGIYLNGFIDGILENNTIKDVIRIGVVLEGYLNSDDIVINLNDKVTINKNFIYNAINSRGTEHNAGIWVEPAVTFLHQMQYKTDHVLIQDNVIFNTKSSTSERENYGIFLGAMNATVIHNTIKWIDTGMMCYFGNIAFINNIILTPTQYELNNTPWIYLKITYN